MRAQQSVSTAASLHEISGVGESCREIVPRELVFLPAQARSVPTWTLVRRQMRNGRL
jgi:hypothetical protein